MSAYWLGVLTIPAALVVVAFLITAYFIVSAEVFGKRRECSVRMIVKWSDVGEGDNAPR